MKFVFYFLYCLILLNHVSLISLKEKFLNVDYEEISKFNLKLIEKSGFENLINDTDLEVKDIEKTKEDDLYNFGYHEDYTPLER